MRNIYANICHHSSLLAIRSPPTGIVWSEPNAADDGGIAISGAESWILSTDHWDVTQRYWFERERQAKASKNERFTTHFGMHISEQMERSERRSSPPLQQLVERPGSHIGHSRTPSSQLNNGT